jgi:hypothetical protein
MKIVADAGNSTASLSLDVKTLDLTSLKSLAGSALDLILRDLKEDEKLQGMARHSSHSSYSTHGTAAW